MPDERLNQLAGLVKPQKVLPTTIEIVDIAGLVKGASKGEGLGNQFLSNIRETDAIIHVLRCFENPNVIHVDGSVDPIRDKEVIDTELQLKDLDSIEKRLEKVAKAAKVGQDKEAVKQAELLKGLKAHLEQGLSVRTYETDEDGQAYIESLFLLTSKPVLYLCNVDEAAVKSGNEHIEKVKAIVEKEKAEMLMIAAEIESEIGQLESEEDRKEFLAEMGLDEPGLNKLIKSAYKLLSLYTYFTAGEKEVRAWTIPKGAKAPQAAGVIHTDFEKGFIRAEVIQFNDFIALGSEIACKEAGKLSVEGKEYVVKDGDIMHFRFNV